MYMYALEANGVISEHITHSMIYTQIVAVASASFFGEYNILLTILHFLFSRQRSFVFYIISSMLTLCIRNKIDIIT